VPKPMSSVKSKFFATSAIRRRHAEDNSTIRKSLEQISLKSVP
jgi:hypothetical protein